ncbi:DsbA family oxidoreductase [Subtercola endophyticus]|uniref:DsbA family oxidoreductase n=1 Tax=Subtercola endophyticus TaxID=2895559 RepID=UPI001E46D3C9|nr:DsbA family oxidoreductase [Subtercola endophyticus]UFS58182.1 DsbA family oxidoreductase [Subtercola endophyticus]
MPIDTTTQSAPLRIDAWVDVACPWCYVGKKRLETAIASSGHSDDIHLVLHTFELDPGAPKVPVSNPQYVARHMGVTVEKAVELEQRMSGLAAAEGLGFTVERIHASSFDALRLVHLAAEYDAACAFFSTVQNALFAGRADTYSREFLLQSAVSAGIPEPEATDVLDGTRFTEEVAADRAEALQLGARGVPFTVIDQKYGVPGVISVGGYSDAIATAWAER